MSGQPTKMVCRDCFGTVEETVKQIKRFCDGCAGETLERAWRSLFNMCNHVLTVLRGMDFEVEHVGTEKSKN